MSDNAKDGAEKGKGIALSAGSDICNHTRKLKLMMSRRSREGCRPICGFPGQWRSHRRHCLEFACATRS